MLVINQKINKVWRFNLVTLRTNHSQLKTLIVCLLLLVIRPVLAADWNVSTQLTMQTTYTDNLQLTRDNNLGEAKKEGDLFFDVAPGVVVTGKGRHLNLDFAYSPQYIHYLSAQADDQVNHQLQMNAQSEIYQNHLFFDLSFSAQQELIDSLGVAGRDAANPTENIQTTYTYSVAPNYKSRLGSFANFSFTFEKNGVFYSEEGGNSSGYLNQVNLSSSTAATALNWAINVKNQALSFEDETANTIAQEPTQEFNSATASVGYQLNERWQLMVLAGYEDNDYAALSETSGEQWQFSSIWTPTMRTRLYLSAGHRYFGWSPSLEWTHRSKHSAWTASFSRAVTNAHAERLNNEAYNFKDAFGDIVVPDTGERLTIQPGTAIPTSLNFINSQFQTGYAVQARRNTIGTTIRYLLREYEGMAQDEKTTGASVFWTRKLTGLTTSHLAVSWDKNQRQNSILSNEQKSVNFSVDTGLTRQLSARTNLDLQYHFLDGEQYTENRFTLGLRMTWQD
ncbi:TIGR03016 family PEP-CTERM system-associated outer membrane protein [Chromatium okenii]|nr:TIGR03016 family PEP-CTERM system-associated outer membrane protein [Chromatium okenii]